jgi:hypothetical protein
MLLPLVLLFFVIGLFPNLFFDKINPSVEAMVGARRPSCAARSAGMPRCNLHAAARRSQPTRQDTKHGTLGQLIMDAELNQPCCCRN